MLVFLFLKVLAVCVGVSLLGFGILGGTAIDLLRFLCVGIGASIIITIIYPHFRGVRRGDRIFVGFPFVFGVAMSDGRKGKIIKVKIDDEVFDCVVEDYEGFLSYARGRIVREIGLEGIEVM